MIPQQLILILTLVIITTADSVAVTIITVLHC
jgi:hypothetical protein